MNSNHTEMGTSRIFSSSGPGLELLAPMESGRMAERLARMEVIIRTNTIYYTFQAHFMQSFRGSYDRVPEAF